VASLSFEFDPSSRLLLASLLGCYEEIRGMHCVFVSQIAFIALLKWRLALTLLLNGLQNQEFQMLQANAELQTYRELLEKGKLENETWSLGGLF